MRQVIARVESKDYSVHEETNSFWNHLLVVFFTPNLVDLLKVHAGTALINKMDQRLRLIPRYLGLKIFKFGLTDLALFTASEYKYMIKVMPFVLKGLFEEKKNESLVQMFVNWNKMYYQSKQPNFTRTELFQFESIYKK
ncbi:29831_t:CDS:2 [Gigaspora margarita]|uniref:29831_t:CDS:1 n=1 Tax=Gigaspora margarita TaxID=4874 RepID=A0ABN7WDK0_GIGMA|nr:29831_t:CDS:2 [Gigaspora margarita]